MFNSPVGALYSQTSAGKLQRLSWNKLPEEGNQTVEEQLKEYFNNKRQDFDIEFDFSSGTPFQQKVWRVLCTIPYGKTVTYGDLARMVGSHPRAIGGAVGANPLPIVVPCHRVVGAHGNFGGYSGAGGLDTKRFLLELEGALA